MNMLKKAIVICLLLTGHVVFAQTNEPTEVSTYISHITNWDALLKEASSQNKLIFVDVYFTGCIPCAQMDKQVFPNEIVAGTLQKYFLPVKCDVFKENLGDSINRKYLVSGFPTYLILSKEGKLIDRFSGFADAGKLTERLETALRMNQQKQFINGYSSSLDVNYPVMYKEYFQRTRKPLDPAAAVNWINENRNSNPEAAAMLFLALNKPEASMEDEFIGNYKQFASFFGDDVSLNKAIRILSRKMNTAFKAKDEAAFQHFIEQYQPVFNAEDYKVVKHLLANEYFNTIAADTTGYLKFMVANPVIFQNYFGAYFSNLRSTKQLTAERMQLLAEWGQKAMDDNSSFDIMALVAGLYRQLNKPEECKAVVNRIIAKGKKYKVDTSMYEKIAEGI